MTYLLVTEHEDGATLKEIAEAAGIDFSCGEGFYELTKKEKVSAKKTLVIFKNGEFLSDDTNNVKTICGLAVDGDVNITPENIPTNHKLFVQSTSANRKISADSGVVFVVEGGDDDEDDEEEGDEDDADEDEDEDDDSKTKEEENDGEPLTKKQRENTYSINFEGLTQVLQDGDDEDFDHNLVFK